MILNYRQLGQDVLNKDEKKIRTNSIIRCAYPENASEEQFDVLNNLDVIFDLRNDYEIKAEPSFRGEDVIVKNFKIGGDFSKNSTQDINFALEDMIKFYGEVLPFNSELVELFTELKNNKSDFMFHCTAGKDRTGTVGIILMNILDFDEEDIKKEYLELDNRLVERLIEKFEQNGLELSEETLAMFSVSEQFYDSLVNSINEKYGSFDNYLKEYLNLSEEDINEFKDYYLE